MSATATTRFVTVCLECWKPTGQDAFGVDCHTCENCGHHKQGARQAQHGRPCPTGECPPPTHTLAWFVGRSRVYCVGCPRGGWMGPEGLTEDESRTAFDAHADSYPDDERAVRD